MNQVDAKRIPDRTTNGGSMNSLYRVRGVREVVGLHKKPFLETHDE